MTTARVSGWKTARGSVARPALTTGHGIRMYSLVPVRVVRQQSWLANSSWRPARSSDNILFRDASCCSLMTDCGGYAHFSCCYRFLSPYVCTAQYLVKQTLCSSFILIYFAVNSDIVNKARNLWRLSFQKSDITKKGDRRSRKTGDHRSLSHKPEVSAPEEPLGSRGQEVGAVALLLLLHTPPRTLRPAHETRGASLHMLR